MSYSRVSKPNAVFRMSFQKLSPKRELPYTIIPALRIVNVVEVDSIMCFISSVQPAVTLIWSWSHDTIRQ